MHMNAVRRRAMGENNRAHRSIEDHMEIIEALEVRDPELASRLVREHTMKLHDHVKDRWTRLANLAGSRDVSTINLTLNLDSNQTR
jgi:DNA-binding GntR family transcriptional regulator